MYEYRLEIIKGHDKGSIYKINGTDLSIGRDPDNDFVLHDANISAKHLRLNYTGKTYIVEDLNSDKGTFVNKKRVKEQQIFSGDIVSLAKSYEFKFIIIKEKDPLDVPPAFDASIEVPTGKKKGGNLKKIIIGVLILLVAVMFLMPEETVDKSKEKKKTETKDEKEKDTRSDFEKFVGEDIEFRKKVPKGMESLFKKAENVYLDGRREFASLNYLRALDFFKRALSFYPSHGQARHYAKLCLEMLKQEAKKHLILGKKLMYQFKYAEALKHFDSVLTLLLKREKSKIYQDADKMRKIAEKKLEEYK